MKVSIEPESVATGAMGHRYILAYLSDIALSSGRTTPVQRSVDLAEKEHLFYTLMRSQLSACANIPVRREADVAQLGQTQREKGTRLFDHFFSASDAQEILRTRGLQLQLDSSLYAFPWELMRSSVLGTIDAVGHPITRVLALPDDSSHPKETLFLDWPKVLFLGADPESLSTSTRAKDVLTEIKSSFEGTNATLLKDERAFAKAGVAQYERFWDGVREYEPSIVHIVAHGGLNTASQEKGLMFEGNNERSSRPVAMELLLRALEGVPSVRILIVMACQSGPLFEECIEQVRISPGLSQIEAVVCVASDVSTQANKEFTRCLYKYLWSKLDLATAVAYARQGLLSHDELRLQWSIPMLYETSPVNPFARLIERAEGLKDPPPPLTSEYLELVAQAATAIGEAAEWLDRCSSQLRPSKIDRTFWLSKLKTGLDKLEHALKMFEGRRYAADDRTLLHELERQCRRSMLVLYHHIDGNPSATIEKLMAASERITQQVRDIQEALIKKHGG